VTQLQSDGLAERRAGEDRRRVEVRLTRRGHQRARQARAARDRIVTSATSALTVAQARTLEALLDKLVSARVTSRLERRRAGEAGAWWCRTCDFAACGRPSGRCPAQATGAQTIP
jgi:rubrerythrin